MAKEPRTAGLTYSDLLQMFPEEDLVRREIIEGELFVTPSPVPRHQWAVTLIGARILAHVERHGGRVFVGPIDVLFSERDVVEPDVVYVAPGRLEHFEERPFREAPDLVVEVSSPPTRRRDLVAKRELYERGGVPEYWFVDLDADRVLVHHLEQGRYGEPAEVGPGDVVESRAVPGFRLPAEDALGLTDPPQR